MIFVSKETGERYRRLAAGVLEPDAELVTIYGPIDDPHLVLVMREQEFDDQFEVVK